MSIRSVALLIALHAAFAAAILVAGIVAGHADPARYRAVTLVCASELRAADCDRASALDIIATVPVPTPFACMMGGMGAAVHGRALANGGYLKVVCEVR